VSSDAKEPMLTATSLDTSGGASLNERAGRALSASLICAGAGWAGDGKRSSPSEACSKATR
jgi:hypothetical protein